MAKKETMPEWLPVLDYSEHSPAAAEALNQFRKGQMSHAFLITGAKGTGKLTFSKVLAAALFCTSPEKPCLKCAACTQILQGNHPDVTSVFSQDNKLISVDTIRAEVLDTIAVHSESGLYRVIMIEPVDRLSPSSQNALLKSLEDPPGKVVFLLMAHEMGAALGTIVSRCRQIKLLPRSDAVMLSTLQQCGFTKEAIMPVLRPSCGNIGLAIGRLMQSTNPLIDEAFKQTLCLQGDRDLVKISFQMKEFKDLAPIYLAQLEDCVHRAVMFRSGCGEASLVEDLPPLWQKAARHADFSSFSRILEGIRSAQIKLNSQVNWQSNLEHLLMIILEETSKWQRL